MGECSDSNASSPKSRAASSAGSNEAPEGEEHPDYKNFSKLVGHKQHIWAMIRVSCSEYAYWFGDYSEYCNNSIKRYGFATVDVLKTKEHFEKWLKLCKATVGRYLDSRHTSKDSGASKAFFELSLFQSVFESCARASKSRPSRRCTPLGTKAVWMVSGRLASPLPGPWS